MVQTQIDPDEHLFRELLLESTQEAIREVTSGQFPPGGTVETGGQMKNISPSQAPGATAEMRGAPQSRGVQGGFFTGQGAPLETGGMVPGKSGPSHHVSDDSTGPNIPGPSEHVSEACATCGHSNKAHPRGSTCIYCSPKGSMHRLKHEPDMRPTLVKMPLAGPDGHVRETVALLSEPELHRRMFTEEEQAAIRITEVMKGETAGMYAAHSGAAMRQSLQAYSTGDPASHMVASAHHQLAADAAKDASEEGDDSQKKDFKTMASFHSTQAETHKKAAAVARKSGGSNPIMVPAY